MEVITISNNTTIYKVKKKKYKQKKTNQKKTKKQTNPKTQRDTKFYSYHPASHHIIKI